MRYFETFAGVGGFSQAMPDHFECVGISEIDKFASAVLKYRFRTAKTREELQADLDSIKTILSEKNYGMMEVCYVNTVKSGTTFIKTTNQSVKSASEHTKLSGVEKILNTAGKWGEGLTLCEDSECWICMEENVHAVEKKQNNSLPLNIKGEMDILTEKNMELAICINSPSKFTSQKNTKSCATTVITLKQGITYAHIKRTKPIHNYGDIKKINWNTVPDFDLLVGGSPCQDLSVAGKQRGLNGERSGLFYEYVRALKEKRPSYFIWENVKGALSSNQGWDFAEVLNQFSEAGYSLWWQVLNAKDFGVPQNRERIFVIGTRNGSPREILFERTADKNTVVSNTIRTGGKGSLTKKHAWDLIQINNPRHSNDRVYSSKGISPTLNTMQGGNRQPFIAIPVLTPDRINKRQNGRRFKTDGEEMFTLNTQDRHGVFDSTKIRRITPLECERLMSWPDNWTQYGIINGEKKEISDTQRYKMCGNGVVSEVVKQIIIHHFL